MKKKTISEMSEAEKQKLGSRAYKLLAQLWALQHGCRIAEEVTAIHKEAEAV